MIAFDREHRRKGVTEEAASQAAEVWCQSSDWQGPAGGLAPHLAVASRLTQKKGTGQSPSSNHEFELDYFEVALALTVGLTVAFTGTVTTGFTLSVV